MTDTQKNYVKAPEALCAKEGIIVPVYLDKEAYDLCFTETAHPFAVKVHRKLPVPEYGTFSEMLQKILASSTNRILTRESRDTGGEFEFSGFMLLERFTWSVTVENGEPVMRVDHVEVK